MKAPADYHVHSRFSMDSITEPAEMVESALRLGMQRICFTEHKDLDPLYEYHGFYDDLSYSEEISALKKRFEGKIGVFKGIELDFQSHQISASEDFIKAHRFDFVLASVHALNHRFVGAELFRDGSAERIYEDYLNQVLVLSQMDFFDILGHLDYVKRYGEDFKLFDPRKYTGIIEEILNNLIDGGRGIELNVSGWRHGRSEGYPGRFILEKYHSMGGEIITVGSDAHTAEDLGAGILRGIDMLKEIGFRNVYVFEERKGFPVSI